MSGSPLWTNPLRAGLSLGSSPSRQVGEAGLATILVSYGQFHLKPALEGPLLPWASARAFATPSPVLLVALCSVFPHYQPLEWVLSSEKG